MKSSIPECPLCGTWVCAQCGWKRLHANADPAWQHACHRCGGTRGSLVPARHRNESIRADHAAAALRKES